MNIQETLIEIHQQNINLCNINQSWIKSKLNYIFTSKQIITCFIRKVQILSADPPFRNAVTNMILLLRIHMHDISSSSNEDTHLDLLTCSLDVSSSTFCNCRLYFNARSCKSCWLRSHSSLRCAHSSSVLLRVLPQYSPKMHLLS
jgi:hypothetical protein